MSNATPLITFIASDPDAKIPQYQTAGAAGADLACVLRDQRGQILRDGITLAPMERRLIDTGLRLDIPDGFEVQVRPRSGLALKHGLTVLNSPGTIDSDYKGPLMVLLCLLGSEPYTIHHGDRIAQMVMAPVTRFTAATRPNLEGLSESDRGDRGFGSTGR